MIESNKSRTIHLTNSLEVSEEITFSLDSELGDEYILDINNVEGQSTPFLDFQKINNFLGSNSLVLEKQKNHQINYLFNIESNKNNMLVEDVVDDIKEYRSNINQNIYDQFSIFSSKIFDNRKNAKLFLESITKKYNKFNALKLKIEKGIEEKQDNIVSKNFANKLKKYINNKEDSYYFNIVTDNFIRSIDNVSLLTNKSIKSFTNITLYRNVSNNTELNIDKNAYKDHLFLAFDNNYDRSLQTFSSGFVVQNLVTMIRNLFFLSPNSFRGNVPSNISDKTIFNNFDKNNFVVCLSEREGLDFFKNINAKNYEISTSNAQKDLKSSQINSSSQLLANYEMSLEHELDKLKNIGARFDYIYEERTLANHSNSIVSFVPSNENTSNIIEVNTQFPLWYISQNNADYITLTQIQAVKKKIVPFNKDVLSQEFSFLDEIISSTIPLSAIVTYVADDLKNINDMFYGRFFNQSLDSSSINIPIPVFGFNGSKLGLIKEVIFQLGSRIELFFDYLRSVLPKDQASANILSREGSTLDSFDSASSLKGLINNFAINNQVIYYKDEPVIIYDVDSSIATIDLSEYNEYALRSLNIEREIADFTDNETIIKCLSGTHNHSFKVDMSNIRFKDLDHKLSIDNIVKFSKLKHSVDKGFNIELIDSVLNNINSSSYKNFMLAFSKENSLDNIAIVDKKSEVYDLLFTEEEEKTYSNIDLVSEATVNGQKYEDVNRLKKNNLDINKKFFEKADMLKGLLSNYYPQNNIFSSSVLFRNIVKSIVDESKIENNSGYNKNLTQSLYFHYINSETSNEDVKKLIAKRFIKKAIQKDVICKSNFSNASLDSFIYKTEQIDTSSIDESSKSSVKNYIDKCLQTSPSLNLIKNTVFSNKNVNSLSDLVRFKRVNNIDISQRTNRFYVNNPEYNINSNNNLNITAGGSGLPPLNDHYISAVILYNVLPNYCMLYDFYSNGDIQSDASLELEIQNKNDVDEVIVYGQANDVGIKEVISERYFVDKSVNGFDVTSSDKIQVLVRPVVNVDREIYNRTSNREKPYILVEDKFDDIFKYQNETEKNSYCFNKIIDIIQDILRLTIKDYLSLRIENESNIDTIINSNSFLVEKTLELLKVYSSIYDNYTYRLQRHRSVCVFKNMLNFRIDDLDNNSNFPRLGYVSSHFNSFDNYRPIYPFPNAYTSGGIIDHDENILSDLDRILNYYDSNHRSLYESDLDASLSFFRNETSFTNFFTDFSEMIFVTLRDLHISDFYQALNFDIVNSALNYVSEISEKSYEEIFESTFIDEIDEIKDDVKEKINDNFYNTYFLNKLSKGLAEMESHNESNIKLFKQMYQSSDFSEIKNINVFEKISQEKERKNRDIIAKVNTNSLVQKECFGENLESYLNSNFTVVGLKLDEASLLNNESLIVVTANIVDKFNLNRFYIPKIFMFSGVVAGDISNIVNNFTKNDIYTNFKNVNLSNLVGYYNTSESLDSRYSAENVNQFVESDSESVNGSLARYLRDVISKKFRHLQRQMLSISLNSGAIPRPNAQQTTIVDGIPVGVSFSGSGFSGSSTESSASSAENNQPLEENDAINYNDVVNFLSKYTINCHISSEEGKKIISGIYDIDVFSSFYSSKKIDIDIFNLLKNMDKKSFFAVFNQEKEKVLDGLVFNDSDSTYSLPDDFLLSHDSFVYLLLENLESIVRLEHLNNIVFDEFYEKYVLAINPKEFVYVDLDDNTKNTILEGIEEEFLHSDNKLFLSLCKVLELDNIVSEVDRRQMKFKKSLSEIDNFEIVLNVKVM